MTDTLKSLKDRLGWISNTSKQAIWLYNYLMKQGWFESSRYNDIFNKQGGEFLTLIKSEWSHRCNTAEERERINKARSAWNSHSKKSKNQTYSLSSEAKKKVEQFAKKNDITRSRVIEELIMQADSLNKLEAKIRKLLRNINTQGDDGNTIIYRINSVSDVLKVNELKCELECTVELLREKKLELINSINKGDCPITNVPSSFVGKKAGPLTGELYPAPPQSDIEIARNTEKITECMAKYSKLVK